MHDDSAHHAGHEASRALYRWRALSYDLQLAPYEFIRRHAVERLQLQPGQCVLDLGCGTGMSLALLRQAVGPQGRVVAVDQSPEMIALARSRVQLEGWDNVELLCAAVEDAPLPGAADAAFFHLVHDILQSPRAVEHVLHHLKPGARLAATGLKWTAPWLAPWNALVGLFAAQSITNFDRLAVPWQPLLDHGAELQVESVLMGTLYVASGTAPKVAVRH